MGLGLASPASGLTKLLPVPETWLRKLPASLALRFKCLLELKQVQGPPPTSQGPVPDPPGEERFPGYKTLTA